MEENISILHCLVSAAGRGSFIREGVGDLQIQETSWDQADGVGLKIFYEHSKLFHTKLFYLPDPALLDVPLERELHEHGSEGVGISHLRHPEISKTSLKIRNFCNFQQLQHTSTQFASLPCYFRL